MARNNSRPSPILLAFFFSLLVLSGHVVGQQDERTWQRLRDARQCRIQRLSASRPARRIESEGGVTEFWNENEDQFQCAGVSAMRNVIQPSALSLPNFSPSPRLVYIQQGQALLGISYPGCVETYHSRGQACPRSTGGGQPRQGGECVRDQHQKVHRLRQGDIVALPAGVAHWCYNDGDEEFIAVSVTDVNSVSNQLDQRPMSFYLAGGWPKKSSSFQQQEQEKCRENYQDNILRSFDANMLAEAFSISTDLVRKIQREDNRGYIVKVQRGEMSMIRPDEEEEEEMYGQNRANGLEETYCTMRINQYLDHPREADIFSRQAGRLNTVNMNKLPILRYLDMSAEKGNLYSNAMVAPHWSMNAHTIIYVTRGEGRMQAVGYNGRMVFDEMVKEGDMVVVPQYFATMKRAGNKGFEYVAFKTSASPMRSPIVGYTSVFKAMPLQVLTNSYQISNKEAQNLKYNREHQMLLFPPSTTSS